MSQRPDLPQQKLPRQRIPKMVEGQPAKSNNLTGQKVGSCTACHPQPRIPAQSCGTAPSRFLDCTCLSATRFSTRGRTPFGPTIPLRPRCAISGPDPVPQSPPSYDLPLVSCPGLTSPLLRLLCFEQRGEYKRPLLDRPQLKRWRPSTPPPGSPPCGL